MHEKHASVTNKNGEFSKETKLQNIKQNLLQYK